MIVIIYYVLGTQENIFTEIAGTLPAQPGGFLVALLAGLLGHLIAGQQADRVLGHRFSMGNTQHFDIGYRAGAEIVYMAKNHSRLKKSVGFSIHVYFNSTQTTKIELT